MWALKWLGIVSNHQQSKREEPTWREEDTVSFDEESTIEESIHGTSSNPSLTPYYNKSGIIKDANISKEMKNCRQQLYQLQSIFINELNEIRGELKKNMEEISYDYALYNPDPVDTWKKLKDRKEPLKSVSKMSGQMNGKKPRIRESSSIEDLQLIKSAFLITEEQKQDWREAELQHKELEGWFKKENENDRNFLDMARKIAVKKLILDSGYVPVFSRKSSREPGDSQDTILLNTTINTHSNIKTTTTKEISTMEGEPHPAFSLTDTKNTQTQKLQSEHLEQTKFFEKYTDSDEEEMTDESEKSLKTPEKNTSTSQILQVNEIEKILNQKHDDWEPINSDLFNGKEDDDKDEEGENDGDENGENLIFYGNNSGAEGLWEIF